MIALSTLTGKSRASSPTQTAPIWRANCAVVFAARDHVDPATAVQGDLDHHVGRRAEAVEGQRSARPRIAPPQRPIADNARTQQRGRLDVAERLGQRVDEIGRRHGILGVAAVGVIAGEAGRLAEVLLSPGAEAALAAGVPQPGHAHPLAQTNGVPRPARLTSASSVESSSPKSPSACGPILSTTPDDLMAGDDGHFLLRQVALDDVQIGAADGTATDPNPHFARPRLGDRHVRPSQRGGIDRGNAAEEHRFHNV